jgi:1-acyl-sn-glycerol-3-phosphate acyltransferase
MLDVLLIGAMRFLVGGSAEWDGTNPEPRQRIYFANHGSHLDTLMIWGALPRTLRSSTHPVAGADYWGRPGFFRSRIRAMMGIVLIDRSGKSRDDAEPVDVLEPAKAALQAGKSLIIFPEGTRGTSAIPAPFKAGLFHLAEAFPQAELVPVYLRNPSRAMPKGAVIPIPIACNTRFGAPIGLKQGEAKAEFLNRAHASLVALAPSEQGT